MQAEIKNDIDLAQGVNPCSCSRFGVKLITISTDYEEITNNSKKLNRLFENGVIDKNFTRYLTGINRLRYHELVYFVGILIVSICVFPCFKVQMLQMILTKLRFFAS